MISFPFSFLPFYLERKSLKTKQLPNVLRNYAITKHLTYVFLSVWSRFLYEKLKLFMILFYFTNLKY